MRVPKTSWLVRALLPVGVLGQLSKMGVVFATGLKVLNGGPRGGLNGIPSAAYELYQWPWGSVPQRCYRSAVQDKLCDPYDMEVFDVWFSDCLAPWKLCRCKNSPMTAWDMADRMAQIPVTARQYIRFWSSYDGRLSAGNGGNDITIFGDASNITSIFFHEVAHSLDSWAMGTEYQGRAFSDRVFWKAVVAGDTCVPDAYAKTSYNENFAQVCVMIAYNTQVRSIHYHNVECMATQVEHGQKILGRLVAYDHQARCTRRWSEQDSPRVCMGPRARKAGRCPGMPDPEINGSERSTWIPDETPLSIKGNNTQFRYPKGASIGAPVDEVAEGEDIKVQENRARDPAKQRLLEEKDAQRWRETLKRAGFHED